ncbi:hypothetical protein AAG906_028057 [Vitis piasezkii]
MYGKENLTLDEGMNSRARSKFETKKFKCFICHKEGHFKKDCPDRRQKTVKKTMNEGDVAVILDGHDSTEVLNMAEVDSSKEWILDSGCSFHMCPIKAWFEDFKEVDGGHVLLGGCGDSQAMASEAWSHQPHGTTTAVEATTEEIVDMDLKTYQEATNSNEANQWLKAIQEEMDSLRKNETWELDPSRFSKESKGHQERRLQVHEDLELDQLDVKTIFLHGELDELIYMQPPERFGEGIKDEDFGNEVARDMSKRLLRLSQKSYILKVLSRCEMNNLKTMSTPLGKHFRLSITQAPETHEEKRFMERIPYASMVGSVMYTMVCSRPDLAYAVNMISRYMSCLGKPYWQTIKWLFQYLAGTRSLGLVYGGNSQLGTQLQGFVDVDYAGNIDTIKSLTGYLFISVVSLLTTEVEYMAMKKVVKEAIWLKGIIEELGMYKGKERLKLEKFLLKTIHPTY